MARTLRLYRSCAVVGVFAGSLVPAARAREPIAPAPIVELTARQDHQRLMDLLRITSLRPGANGSDRQAPNYANYDENRANPCPNLPDPLLLKKGRRITSARAWWERRRREIVEEFDREVYGRVPKATPGVKWELVSTTNELNRDVPVITKKLVGHVDNASYAQIAVDIQMTLTTPAHAAGPVPVMVQLGFAGPDPVPGRIGAPGGFRPPGAAGPPGANRPAVTPSEPGSAPPAVPRSRTPSAGPAAPPAAQSPSAQGASGIPPRLPGPPGAFGDPPRFPGPPGGFGAAGGGPNWQGLLLAKGWGFAVLSPNSIQPDNGAGLTHGIIGLVNRGQPRKLDDWGALRAWAWGASRALDYLESDSAVNAKQVGIEGHSRYGKAALVAMAYDPRFAIAYISSSGEGGAKLHRRNWGELVENVAGIGEYHWMAGNFLKYAGPLTPADLPVDSHELVALCAPRPVFLGAGATSGDGWADAKGTFLAAVGAGPVYKLLGKRDMGTTEFPEIETALIDGDVAFRQHKGGHTDAPNWPTFLSFASRYISAPAISSGESSPLTGLLN